MKVKLSSTELEKIIEAQIHCKLVIPPSRLKNMVLDLTAEEANNLRECCSEYLLFIGFDCDYKVNKTLHAKDKMNGFIVEPGR